MRYERGCDPDMRAVVRLSYPNRAFPFHWERDPRTDDGHGHHWQDVIVETAPGRLESVIRCAICLCPRCGDAFDDDPCVERRHHRGLHIYESGRFAPLGGHLSDEADGETA